jgi:hypothetical protein
MCSTLAAIEKSYATADHQKLLGATRYGKRDGAWPSRTTQGVRNTLARDDHEPITDELSDRIKQRLYQRMATSKVGGCVSTRGWQNNVDLASKIVEKLKHG